MSSNGSPPDIGDGYTPTFIRVNADGTISYDFDGHIHAQGLDLDTAPAADFSKNQVRWTRTSDGAISGYLASVDAESVDGTFFSQMVALSPDNTDSAVLQAAAENTGGLLTRLRAIIGGTQVTMLNGAGESSFLQLNTLAKRKLSFGVNTSNYGAGVTGNVAIAHGLGVAPVIVLLSPAQDDRIIVSPGNFGAVNFSSFLRDVTGAALNNRSVVWAAIG